jgi:hypothetical protein
MTDLAETRRPLAGRLAPQGESVVALLPDARADGRRRRVEFSPARILIERSVAGVAMRLNLAPSAYRGVALGVVVEDGLPAYEVALVHADPELSARLALADRESDALAALRLWADWFALPRLIEGIDGVLIEMETPQRPRPARRRVDLARRRRPRFLVRRKPGAPARMARVHAGEREIVCYE